jgi:hypothetical protein
LGSSFQSQSESMSSSCVSSIVTVLPEGLKFHG